MYTSDTENCLRRGLRYLTAAVTVASAGGIYEYFSHGVFSPFMVYAFLVPLLAGAAPNFLAALYADSRGSVRSPAAAGLQLAAVATLTSGSVMKGVLDIYGTTNHLMIIYPVAGLALLAAALAAYAAGGRRISEDI